MLIFFYIRIPLKKNSSLSIESSFTEARFVVPPSQNKTKRKNSRIQRKLKSSILTDPNVKKSKSKILPDLSPNIDLSIQKIKSITGPSKSKIKPVEFNLDSKSSTFVKILGYSEKTLPMLELSDKVPKKSSSEFLSLGKGDLKISSKLLSTKSKLTRTDLTTKSKVKPKKK